MVMKIYSIFQEFLVWHCRHSIAHYKCYHFVADYIMCIETYIQSHLDTRAVVFPVYIYLLILIFANSILGFFLVLTETHAYSCVPSVYLSTHTYIYQFYFGILKVLFSIAMYSVYICQDV